MALIVEDGTGKPDADSYGSVADLVSIADLVGQTLPTDLAVLEPQVRIATNYIDRAYRTSYCGSKTNDTQALQWPRTGAKIDGVVVADNAIPKQLLEATVFLVVHLNSGGTIYASAGRTQAGTFVTNKTIGPLSKSYGVLTGSDGRSGGLHGSRSELEAIIAPLLCSGGITGVYRGSRSGSTC